MGDITDELNDPITDENNDPIEDEIGGVTMIPLSWFLGASRNKLHGVRGING